MDVDKEQPHRTFEGGSAQSKFASNFDSIDDDFDIGSIFPCLRWIEPYSILIDVTKRLDRMEHFKFF